MSVQDTYEPLWERFGRATHTDRNFKKFQWLWFLKRFSLTPLQFHQMIVHKTVLEIGTGSGAFLRRLLAAKSLHGLDTSKTGLAIAREFTHDFPQIHLIEQDLMDHEGQYDVVIADQVLHHTTDTFKALKKAVSLVTPGGVIMFYVYKKKAPVREFMDNFLRYFTTKLSQENCLRFSKFTLWLGETLTLINLGLQRWVYWNIIKCFYNEGFSYDNNLRVNYDWYSPKLAHWHTRKEVEHWIKSLDLLVASIYEGRSGISVMAHV